MKARIAETFPDWFTVPPFTALPSGDDEQFDFDPDFIVLEAGADDLQEREVLFEADPALNAGSGRRPGN